VHPWRPSTKEGGARCAGEDSQGLACHHDAMSRRGDDAGGRRWLGEITSRGHVHVRGTVTRAPWTSRSRGRKMAGGGRRAGCVREKLAARKCFCAKEQRSDA
jgi:hypothetical protein